MGGDQRRTRRRDNVRMSLVCGSKLFLAVTRAAVVRRRRSKTRESGGTTPMKLAPPRRARKHIPPHISPPPPHRFVLLIFICVSRLLSAPRFDALGRIVCVLVAAAPSSCARGEGAGGFFNRGRRVWCDDHHDDPCGRAGHPAAAGSRVRRTFAASTASFLLSTMTACVRAGMRGAPRQRRMGSSVGPPS
jgi:hypothetical protein